MKASTGFVLGALLVGALGIAAPTIETAFTRQTITAHVGDTLRPKYFVQTDTVLGVDTGIVVPKHCGIGRVFLRLYKGATALSGDTVFVNVTPPCKTETPIPPNPTPIDTSLTEPVFNPATGTMLYANNFDAYTTADSLRYKCGQPIPPRVVDHSIFYSSSPTQCYDGGVVVGAGRSGNGVQWHYDGVYQEAHGVILANGAWTPTGKAQTVVQYWAKFTPDTPGKFSTTDASGNGTAIVQIKNVMLWHDNGTRFQFDLHSHQGGCPIYGPSYTMVEAIDQVDAGCNSSQPIPPYFKDFANSVWHRWTILYKPNSVAGARDGVARLWLDGVLISRIEKAACGVTPPGGWKPWCDLPELDALYTNGVGYLEWGANRTDQPDPTHVQNSGQPFTMAIDDVAWWVLK